LRNARNGKLPHCWRQGRGGSYGRDWPIWLRLPLDENWRIVIAVVDATATVSTIDVTGSCDAPPATRILTAAQGAWAMFGRAQVVAVKLLGLNGLNALTTIIEMPTNHSILSVSRTGGVLQNMNEMSGGAAVAHVEKFKQLAIDVATDPLLSMLPQKAALQDFIAVTLERGIGASDWERSDRLLKSLACEMTSAIALGLGGGSTGLCDAHLAAR
jgi:hypothetical protein